MNVRYKLFDFGQNQILVMVYGKKIRMKCLFETFWCKPALGFVTKSGARKAFDKITQESAGNFINQCLKKLGLEEHCVQMAEALERREKQSGE